ncbi:MAG: methyltransferase [Ilumatobacteraceae bacterium]|nr:methyltransferase [Ilumatobacteraceae bacterium]
MPDDVFWPQGSFAGIHGVWLSAAISQFASASALAFIDSAHPTRLEIHEFLATGGDLNARRVNALLDFLVVARVLEIDSGRYSFIAGVPADSSELVLDRSVLRVLFDPKFLYEGSSTIEYFEDLSPDRSRGFALTMEEQLRRSLPDMLIALCNEFAKSVVDVGGGTGVASREIVSRSLADHVFCVDRDEIALQLGRERASAEGLADAVTFIGLDMFTDELPSADLYILSRVLHDWDDGHCSLLFENLTRSRKPNSKVLVFEEMLDSGDWWAFALDFFLSGMLGFGKVRTREQLIELARPHGLLVDSHGNGSGGWGWILFR